MPEPWGLAPAEETTTSQTGSVGDARLDRLLHDLDVANDAHPSRRGWTTYHDTLDDHGEELDQDEAATGVLSRPQPDGGPNA